VWGHLTTEYDTERVSEQCQLEHWRAGSAGLFRGPIPVPCPLESALVLVPGRGLSVDDFTTVYCCLAGLLGCAKWKARSAECRAPIRIMVPGGRAVSGLCPPVSGETSFAAKSFVRYGYVYVYAWVCCFDRGRLGCSIYNSPCYARLDGLVRTARTHASCTMHPSL
jgi:hypothetical protein